MTDIALPTPQEMAALSDLIVEWETNVRFIAASEQAMKTLQARKQQLEIDLIPNLMASAGGIDNFTLNNGTAIKIKDELFASISAAKQKEAFAWLEANGHGAVIKNEMKLSLARGEAAVEQVNAILKACEAAGIDDYSQKQAVHSATLAALIREQLAEGVEVPKETFGVHQQRRAIIKLAKGAK